MKTAVHERRKTGFHEAIGIRAGGQGWFALRKQTGEGPSALSDKPSSQKTDKMVR
jgi:hypothetical protein